MRTISIYTTGTMNQEKQYVTTYLHLSPTQHNHHQVWHTSSISKADNQSQCCNHPCSGGIIMLWQPCWHLHIETGITEVAPSLKQTESNHTGIGLGNNENVPTFPKPRPTTSFVHHDGDGVLHYPGGKVTPCHSSCGCFQCRTANSSLHNNSAVYMPLMVVWIGIGCSSTSLWWVKNMTCVTFRVPWLHLHDALLLITFSFQF
jgi:hypothetical protein